MTAQISDLVSLHDREWDLAAVRGDGLFHPQEHGLEPTMVSTACWHGFQCVYAVKDGRLVLHELRIGLEETPEPFLGTDPLLDPDVLLDFSAIYRNLDHPVRFTGGLLVGREFIEDLYVHMGFHPAWKYEEVRELIVEAGEVRSIEDRSEEARKIREHLAGLRLEPGRDADSDEVSEWVKRTFRLDYPW